MHTMMKNVFLRQLPTSGRDNANMHRMYDNRVAAWNHHTRIVERPRES